MRSGAGSIIVLAFSISLLVKTVLPEPEGPATIQVKGCFSFRVMIRLNSVFASHDYLYFIYTNNNTNATFTTLEVLMNHAFTYDTVHRHTLFTYDTVYSHAPIIYTTQLFNICS